MKDVFISYAHEDRPRARKVAEAVSRAGNWSLFWDRTIPPGSSWYDFVGKELEEARCVIVLWSAASVSSEWVREEADEGKRRRVLLPVFIEAVNAPLGFRAIQGVDLSTWDGTTESSEFWPLAEAVKRIVGLGVQGLRPTDLPTLAEAEAEAARIARERNAAEQGRLAGNREAAELRAKEAAETARRAHEREAEQARQALEQAAAELRAKEAAEATRRAHEREAEQARQTEVDEAAELRLRQGAEAAGMYREDDDEELVRDVREEDRAAAEDPVTGPGARLLIRARNSFRRKIEHDRATPKRAVESETEAIVIPWGALATSATALIVGLSYAVVLFLTIVMPIASDGFQSFTDGLFWFYCVAVAGPGTWALKQVTTILLSRSPVPRVNLNTIVQVLGGVTTVSLMCAAVLPFYGRQLFSSSALELTIMCLPSVVAWSSLWQGRRHAMRSS
jgi:hypothetical protein